MAIINNIFIDQGTDFAMTVDVQNALGNALDLTGYTLAAQIRKTYGSSNVTATFTLSATARMVQEVSKWEAVIEGKFLSC